MVATRSIRSWSSISNVSESTDCDLVSDAMELWRFTIGGGSGGTVDTLLIDSSDPSLIVVGAAGVVEGALVVATVIGADGVIEGALVVATIVGAAEVVEGALLVATIVGAAGVTVTAAGVVAGALVIATVTEAGVAATVEEVVGVMRAVLVVATVALPLLSVVALADGLVSSYGTMHMIAPAAISNIQVLVNLIQVMLHVHVCSLVVLYTYLLSSVSSLEVSRCHSSVQ